jgi:hypothetical protein
MNLIQRIKQRFCRHIDDPINRTYVVPFVGYEFQCPKCKAYVAYFENFNDYIILSELQHNIITDEGKKLQQLEYNYVKYE